MSRSSGLSFSPQDMRESSRRRKSLPGCDQRFRRHKLRFPRRMGIYIAPPARRSRPKNDKAGVAIGSYQPGAKQRRGEGI